MAATAWDRAIGRRLQRLRDARELSMGDLAARVPGAPVTPSQINKLEKGRQQFTAQWIYRLSDALECSPHDLLEDLPYEAPGIKSELAGRIQALAEPDRLAVEQIIDTMSQASTSRRNEKVA